MCAAQVLVQIGAFVWPALLPGIMPVWGLSNSAAGWITAAFYGAYMLSVPVLVTLTDRIDAKRIYLLGVGLTVLGHLFFAFSADGFWTALLARLLAGVGWAGTYMTGLKLLADRVEGRLMSRAVAGHAASIGIAGALSFSAADLIAGLIDWRAAFTAAAISAMLAWCLVVLLAPPGKVYAPADGAKKSAFDFGPIFRNRSAMAYAIAYCVHTLEMNALRGWGVAFLVFVAAETGSSGSLLSPALVVTGLGLLGTVASVLGNETSIRLGRKRLVCLAMLASVLLSSATGIAGPLAYKLAVAIMVVYGIVIWLDSSSLTAGAAGSADPARRGATLAVHSALGYGGGFVGPLMVGWILDLSGGMSHHAWATAFVAIAALMLLALGLFLWLGPRELEGDRRRPS